jgi:hypothetical protein
MTDGHIAVTSRGVVGASWAAHFLGRGLRVVANDPAEGAEGRLRRWVEQCWAGVEALGLAPSASIVNLTFAGSASEAARGAAFIQENVSERIDVKRALIAEIEAGAPPDTLITSSSSGLLVSDIQAGAKQPERIVLGHPFNSPHLIPLVGVLGGKQTSPENVDKAIAFLRLDRKEPDPPQPRGQGPHRLSPAGRPVARSVLACRTRRGFGSGHRHRDLLRAGPAMGAPRPLSGGAGGVTHGLHTGEGCYDSRPTLIRLSAFVMGLAYSGAAMAQAVVVSPSTMPRAATVDQRYQSYNVEMAEVIGGNFWKPYDQPGKTAQNARQTPNGVLSGGAGFQVGQDPTVFEARPPIDLTNAARLRKLTAALGPAYLRVSGMWANTVYFHDSDTPAPARPPKGFMGVLTRPQWKGVIDFAHAVNARLITSFAIGGGVRDSAGVWTPDQARKLLAYTKAAGGEIAAAEFFNEPTMPEYGGAPPGYDAADYVRDFAVFRAFAKDVAPGMPIAGPASVGEAVLLPAMSGNAPSVLKTTDILSASPRPVFDVFSYHFYGAASIRCASMGTGAQTTAEAAFSEEWLSRADRSYIFYSGLRDRFEPSKPIWITEIADAACGGSPWANTFLDSFRYLDQHGRLARDGVSVAFHNTLASSEYGLLDQNTFAPRPNYWAALLWRRLMGQNVLDPGPSRPGLNLYAQCLPGHPGGVTLLAINTSRIDNRSIELPMAAQCYTLTAEKLETASVRLNGQDLKLGANDELPALQGQHIASGQVEFAPASITFLAIEGAANGSCQ